MSHALLRCRRRCGRWFTPAFVCSAASSAVCCAALSAAVGCSHGQVSQVPAAHATEVILAQREAIKPDAIVTMFQAVRWADLRTVDDPAETSTVQQQQAAVRDALAAWQQSLRIGDHGQPPGSPPLRLMVSSRSPAGAWADEYAFEAGAADAGTTAELARAWLVRRVRPTASDPGGTTATTTYTPVVHSPQRLAALIAVLQPVSPSVAAPARPAVRWHVPEQMDSGVRFERPPQQRPGGAGNSRRSPSPSRN